MTKKQMIGSILGGFFAIASAFFHLKDAIQKILAIDVNQGFSESGTIFESIGLIVLMFISVLFGSAVAAYMAKRRYIFIGIFASALYVLFGAVLLVVVFGTALIFSKGAEVSYSSILVSPEAIRLYIWLILDILFSLIGGFLGGFLIKLYFEKCKNQILITNDVYLDDYLEFYFARRWRSFFTITVFMTFVYTFIVFFPNIVTLLKWMTIGTVFITLHPSLWFFASFWFDTLTSLFLPLSVALPVVALHWAYKIGVSKKKLIIKTE